MKRFKRSDYIEVGEVHSGTSAAFVGINQITGKKGIYKENGCMIEIDNEDVREKLASDILTSIGIDCAKIDLVYDEATGQKACFSNYIINDEERLIEPDYVKIEKNNENKINNFVEEYIAGVEQVTGDKKFLNECRKNLYQNIYMCCILDQYDLKNDNVPIVHNDRTGENRISAWFDFGTAFKEDAIQKQSFFLEMSSDEILNEIFENHYNDIKDIANNVNSVLSKENINNLFSSDYVKEAFSNEEVQNMITRFTGQVEKSNTLLERHKDKNKISNKFKSFFEKFTSFFNRKDEVKKLNSGDNNLQEKKDFKSSFSQELNNGLNDDTQIFYSQNERENNTIKKEISDNVTQIK